MDTTSYINGNPTAYPTHSEQWAEFDWGDGFYQQLFGTIGGPISYSISGQFSGIYRWYPINENDTPTELKVVANVVVSASAADRVSSSIQNEQGSVTPTGYGVHTILIRHIPIDVPLSSGGINEETGYFEVNVPWTQIAATAESDFNNPYSPVDGDIGFWYEYDIDDRALTISSSAELTYYKDENGERQPNERQENGSMTADVAATWNETLNMWYWNGSFDTNLIGFPWDSPTYTWTGSLLAGKPNPGDVSSISNGQLYSGSLYRRSRPGSTTLSCSFRRGY